MTERSCPFSGRRGFLTGAGGLFAAALPLAQARAETGTPVDATAGAADGVPDREPFHGPRQGGIITPAQRHSYFASFDLTADNRDAVIGLLQTWTEAAARLTQGDTATPLATAPDAPPGDSGDALGLGPARLTLTFGFGGGLFAKDGKDRYGLAKFRPDALADLPKFNGDQMIEGRTGGDLSIQACADDPQVAFHAIRQLSRLSYGLVENRWVQSGFKSPPRDGGTPRNLMGFKDGTRNPDPREGKAFEEAIWAGEEGPAWMRGGSYVVVRRIRIALEHWERMQTGYQEQAIGRRKLSGAPIGAQGEFDTPDFNAVDQDGNTLIADTSHLRLSAPETNNNARILRRAYSYDDGVAQTAERWPPWHQGMLYDSGLFFVAYQRDPRSGFTALFTQMAKLDMLNQFTTHTGSGLFACPPGIAPGEYIGQKLFESA